MQQILVDRQEFEQLRRDAEWLRYLEAAGVDNWDGIEYAQKLRRDDEQPTDEDSDYEAGMSMWSYID